jgi:hypothetical protein
LAHDTILKSLIPQFGNRLFDYFFSSANILSPGTWISFFDTEEAHAVMLAYAANGGPVDHRSSGPGSSGKSRLRAAAQFGAKKRYPCPLITGIQAD